MLKVGKDGRRTTVDVSQTRDIDGKPLEGKAAQTTEEVVVQGAASAASLDDKVKELDAKPKPMVVVDPKDADSVANSMMEVLNFQKAHLVEGKDTLQDAFNLFAAESGEIDATSQQSKALKAIDDAIDSIERSKRWVIRWRKRQKGIS